MIKSRLMSATIISTLVLLTFCSAYNIWVAMANPYMREYVEDGVIPAPEGSIPPKIEVFSPANGTAYNSNNVTLIFNVTISRSNPVSLQLSELHYSASWQTGTVPLDFWSIIRDNNYSTPSTFSFSITLTDLHEGPRWIEIYAASKAYAYETSNEISGITYTSHFVNYISTASSMANFTIDMTPPVVTLLSTRSTTYYADTGVPLRFDVNEPTSWLGYSLDNQANVTFTGNPTLTGLNDGLHNLTIYAKDTAGNTGKSDILSFTTEAYYVTENPSLSPSPSPTQTPSMGPSETPAKPPNPTPDATIADFAPAAVIVGAVTVIVVAIGLLAYTIKRQRWK